MEIIVFILFGIVLAAIMLGVPLLLWQAQRLAQKQGPQRAPKGPVSWEGTLRCLSWKAPTLNRQLEYAYQVRGISQADDVWSSYRVQPSGGEYVCFRHAQGRVAGRFSGEGQGWVVEGTLTSQAGQLLIGSPRGSFFGLAKPHTPLDFQLNQGKVIFPKETVGGDIGGKNSFLSYDPHSSDGSGTIRGRLEHQQQSWYVDVEIHYRQVPLEKVVLAILMMAGAILSHHHD